MANTPIIRFFYETAGFRFSNRNQLKIFLTRLFKKEATPLQSLNYIFCSDDYLLGINKSYLDHDYYTDIISFNLSNDGPVAGEIYISIDRVRDNANNEGEYLNRELHRVILHGALHLGGYGDKTPKEIREMRSKEDQYLKAYFKWMFHVEHESLPWIMMFHVEHQ